MDVVITILIGLIYFIIFTASLACLITLLIKAANAPFENMEELNLEIPTIHIVHEEPIELEVIIDGKIATHEEIVELVKKINEQENENT